MAVSKVAKVATQVVAPTQVTVEKPVTNEIDLSKVSINIGRSYYDILDILKNKQTTSFMELKGKYQIHDEIMKEIHERMTLEFEQAKSWGYDQLSRSLKK